MQNLGHTRSVHRGNHLLLTPDTFVRAPLPGMKNATAIVHISPAAGAGFLQYTAEMEAGGHLGTAIGQRFLYVLDGKISAGPSTLSRGQFAYAPQSSDSHVLAELPTKVVVIEKEYQSLLGVETPGAFSGDESAVQPSALLGDDSIQVRPFVPQDSGFDFAVNSMTFDPGAALPMVEMHVMEHGLMMLDGGGIYRLGDHWYSVSAGDVIWMGPYCPQWFGALGRTPSRYLIYKNWNRHPLVRS